MNDASSAFKMNPGSQDSNSLNIYTNINMNNSMYSQKSCYTRLKTSFYFDLIARNNNDNNLQTWENLRKRIHDITAVEINS